jgi:hypothetical protein
MATITVGTNSYVTEAELQTYADDRGITIAAADLSVLLIQAMDYIETRAFKGSKTDPSQALEWPRSGVYLNGAELDDTAVPDAIKQAQMAAALICDTGADLLGSVAPRVTAERVGEVSVQYSDKGNQTTLYPKLTALLRNYLANGGGFQFGVRRG